MENPLARVLLKYSENHYLDLFKPGHNLKMDSKKGWIISRERLSKKTENSFYQALVSDLSQTTLAQIPDLEALTSRINQVFQGSIPFSTSPAEVRFKSTDKTYYFLSNFFPTLIVSNERLFRSAEHLYQWKIVIHLDPDNEQEHYDMINKISDPLKARHYSHQVQQKYTPITPEIKEATMREVAPLKYEQNPYLREALLATRESLLIEDTESSFWGGETNTMGRILMDVRTILSELSNSETHR